MRKIFFLGIILFLGIPQAHSCDVCGCSNGLVIGNMLPQFHNNFVGLGFNRFAFDYPSYSTVDAMSSLEIRLRYYLSPKIQVMTSLPYRIINRSGEADSQQIQGWGDATILLMGQILQFTDTSGRGFQHQLWGGLGSNLPIGNSEDNSQVGLPAHFRLGTGTYNLQAVLNYQAMWGKIGMNIQASWQKSVTDRNGYVYGDQAIQALRFFSRIPLGESLMLPTIGLEYEWMGRDVEEGFFRNDTGGEGIFASVGADYFFNNYSFGGTYRHPLVQTYAQGEVVSNARWELRLSRLF
ncbi:MAG: hypothetical protein AAFY71_21760 [Bacteroidota bacterium]